MKKFISKNFQALKMYGYNYYSAYIPSLNRLREKLFKKSQNEELTNQVFEDLSLYIDEQKNIRNYLRYYKERNKNVAYIKQKLQEKKFKKEDVEAILSEEIFSTGDSILSQEYLIKKISELKEKGKSQNAIRLKLIERKEDKSLVEQCLDEVFGGEGNQESIKKTLEKILKGKEKETLTKEEKGKITQKLLLRGFKYDEIQDVLK